jgi:hypothetical protein
MREAGDERRRTVGPRERVDEPRLGRLERVGQAKRWVERTDGTRGGAGHTRAGSESPSRTYTCRCAGNIARWWCRATQRCASSVASRCVKTRHVPRAPRAGPGASADARAGGARPVRTALEGPWSHIDRDGPLCPPLALRLMRRMWMSVLRGARLFRFLTTRTIAHSHARLIYKQQGERSPGHGIGTVSYVKQYTYIRISKPKAIRYSLPAVRLVRL